MMKNLLFTFVATFFIFNIYAQDSAHPFHDSPINRELVRLVHDYANNARGEVPILFDYQSNPERDNLSELAAKGYFDVDWSKKFTVEQVQMNNRTVLRNKYFISNANEKSVKEFLRFSKIKLEGEHAKIECAQSSAFPFNVPGPCLQNFTFVTDAHTHDDILTFSQTNCAAKNSDGDIISLSQTYSEGMFFDVDQLNQDLPDDQKFIHFSGQKLLIVHYNPMNDDLIPNTWHIYVMPTDL